MTKTRTNQLIIAGLLAFLMLATRGSHLGTDIVLPDASWAVFFAAGFLLLKWRWFVPFMALSVGLDFFATSVGGVSDYCMTVAYWFLLPTHAALWFGGTWLKKNYSMNTLGAAKLAASIFVAASVAFLISNGSFYFLSGYAQDLSLSGWWTNFARYYGTFVATTCTYTAVIAAAYVGYEVANAKRVSRA